MTPDQEKKIAEAAEAYASSHCKRNHPTVTTFVMPNWTQHKIDFKAGAALGLQMGEAELESAQEGDRFYRREWESACERYDYAIEENARLKAELLAEQEAHGRSNATNCGAIRRFHIERDALKAEIERLQTVNLAISRNTLDAEKLKAQNEKLLAKIQELERER